MVVIYKSYFPQEGGGRVGRVKGNPNLERVENSIKISVFEGDTEDR